MNQHIYIIKKLKSNRFTQRLLSYVKFARYFHENNTNLSLGRKWELVKRGYFPNREIIYDFYKFRFTDFISDYQENFRAIRINGAATELINNKLIFPRLLTPYIPAPRIHALVESGRLVKFGRESSLEDLNDIIRYLKEVGPLIMKPIDGDGGKGIIKTSSLNSNGNLKWNQDEISEQEFVQKVRRLNHYLISEFVEQAAYSDRIYSKSVNTVRLLTMYDSDEKKAFLAASAHRIGNDISYPVDNCAMGGFTAYIDSNTGVLGKAVSVKRFSDELHWHSFHPDSRAAIEGVQVPHWKSIVETVLKMAENMSFLPYLGWDVVVTKDGFTVLEANDGPDLKLHQVHMPLLLDKRVRDFYAHYKVI